MASRSFENPLIPHDRMRAMYRAMLEVRALSAYKPAGQPRSQRIAPRAEACWVAPAIGLEAQDVVSSSNDSLVAHIRSSAERAGAANRGIIRRFQQQSTVPFAGSPAERLFHAAGQALTLTTHVPQAIVLAFAAADALSPQEWQRLFAVISVAPLPLILTILPARTHALDLTRLAAKAGQHPLPVIPVDASDPLALYRVAQEALVRARAGGGAAVLECIASHQDPIKMLAGQMLARRVNTATWLAAVEPHIHSLLA